MRVANLRNPRTFIFVACSSLLLTGALCGPTGWDMGSQGVDPMQWLTSFANASALQQHVMLTIAGTFIAQQQGMDCNVFGGRLSCKVLPDDSLYVQQCGVDSQHQVDCVYFNEVTSNLYDSPVDNLEEYLKATEGSDVRSLCPQCFDMVQQLWCAAAVPSCGTFQTFTNTGLIPAITTAVQAYSKGTVATRLEAVAEIVSDVLDAASLSLPCREMCDAVMSRCSCGGGGGGVGEEETLGGLLQWLGTQPGLKGTQALPISYGRVLFKKVWNRPFCSLFPSSTQPGFSGVCAPPPPSNPFSASGGTSGGGQYCTSPAAWCDVTSKGRRSDTMRYIQSLLALQVLRAATGWVTDDNAIIWGAHAVMNPVTNSLEEQNARSGQRGPSMPGSQIAGIVILSILAGVGLSLGGFVLWQKWQQRRAEKGYFELSDNSAQGGEGRNLFVSLSDA